MPTWFQILIACLVVAAACVGAAYCFWFGYRHRNWLVHIVGAGLVVTVAGLVGERNPVSATGRPSSVWDMSIPVPLVPLRLDQVTVGGLVLTLVGLALVLFLERVVPPEERWRPPPARRLDDDDSV
ncbi:MAG TPA: hypothetical protein VEK76_11975 [Candidatus Binatia bacterium]|nr:hypothetical protein [Candidatus Binatia bacterium]